MVQTKRYAPNNGIPMAAYRRKENCRNRFTYEKEGNGTAYRGGTNKMASGNGKKQSGNRRRHGNRDTTKSARADCTCYN